MTAQPATPLTVFSLIRTVAQATGASFVKTVALLLLAGLTEGLSIVLLVPIIGVYGGAIGDFEAPGLGADASAAVQPLFHSLPLLLFGLVLLIAARAFLVRMAELTNAKLIQDYCLMTRQSLFESVVNASWSFLASLRGADINHSLTADVDRIQTALISLMTLIRACVMALVYVIVSLFFSWKMTLIAALLGGALLLLLAPLRRRARLYGTQFSQLRQRQYHIIGDFIDSMKASKAFSTEQDFFEKLKTSLRAIRDATLSFTKAASLAQMWVQIGSGAALAVFVYLALDRFDLSPAATIAMIVVYLRLSPRILSIQQTIQTLNANMNALEVVLALKARCLAHEEPRDAQGQAPLTLMRGIRFENVGFNYEAGPAVLSGVSLNLPVGAITAIVGPTASGKSTFADLLMGLTSPSEGAIYIDEARLDDGNRRGWRAMVGYVPQETSLMHDTVRANLLMGAPEASDADIQNALRLAKADKFVADMKDGLETVIGDRGAFMSGGERQRLALARAILRAPALLVLDEATSALDWEHEYAIIEGLKELRGKMTILVIAHRPSILDAADQIIVLKRGRVIESGAADTVLGEKGGYVWEMTQDQRR
ncbi:ABC transporter ATP-binding protein [Marinicaulis aureus]|uniref:ABC transporter ATP-binding protein n=1 Tax=Hyphococcus aureus TaxID=2666033 RepID=A0ABW1KVB4_9PROT